MFVLCVLAGNYPSSELVFEWNSGTRNPVILTRWVTLAEFEVTGAEHFNTCNSHNSIPGVGECLVSTEPA